MKLCECGCGQPVPIAKQSSTKYGWTRGQPMRFINHHFSGSHKMELSPTWRGGRTLNAQGYIEIKRPDGSYEPEHVVIAEQALGHALPAGAEVHHHNENRADNRNTNLVICHNAAYHRLLHRRMRGFYATGSVHGVKCYRCKQWGMADIGDMRTVKRGNGKIGHSYHKACQRLNE